MHLNGLFWTESEHGLGAMPSGIHMVFPALAAFLSWHYF
jgi:hypothetical protein